MTGGRLLAAFVFWSVFAGQTAEAHESRPLYIEITEQGGTSFVAKWRTPASVPRNNMPQVTLPTCQAASPIGTSRGPGGPISQRLFRCADGLSDAAVEVRYPRFNPSVSSLVQVRWSSGEIRSVLASPNDVAIKIPDRETTGGVVREYLVLGVEHILLGYDHLLFVACLVLIAGTFRRILVTITGFTIAHSITLALAALQIVRVPVPPVEATIALSIVFLATELARDRRDTLTWRYPIAVSASFGLLHGFGFASVLSEIGLPQTEIPAALLFFNVGVEIGQILFVVAVVAAMAVVGIFRRRGRRSGSEIVPRALTQPVAYLVGCLAVYWTFDRVSGFWS